MRNDFKRFKHTTPKSNPNYSRKDRIVVLIGYYGHSDVLKVHDFLAIPANVKIFSPCLDETRKQNSSLSSHADSQELPNIIEILIFPLSPRYLIARSPLPEVQSNCFSISFSLDEMKIISDFLMRRTKFILESQKSARWIGSDDTGPK